MTAARVLLRAAAYCGLIACAYWLKFSLPVGVAIAALALAAHYGAEALSSH